MSIAEKTAAPPRSPYVPPIDPEDLRRRNAEMIAILDGWEADGDEDDQKETMAVLRQALGPGRTISDRSAFPAMIDELYLLDSGPLGLVTNPRESDDSRRCKGWMRSALEGEARVMAAEVTDYEVRRELIRAGKARGLARLDTFASRQGILAIDGRAWQRAAELWAKARREGRPTAGGSSLDADVILAAVAQLAAEDGWRVIIVTDNIGHVSRFGDARDWRTLAETL